MASKPLEGKRIALLATDGFEQSELEQPRQLLEAQGARCEVLAPAETREPGQILGWDKKDWGRPVQVDKRVDDATPEDYEALVLPGGQINPDKLRLQPRAIDFIRRFGHSGKPLAAICHGPWTLIDAGLVRGKRMTSWPSVSTDLRNAGALWVDEPAVTDGRFVTSRKPDDIPAFVEALSRLLRQGGAHAAA